MASPDKTYAEWLEKFNHLCEKHPLTFSYSDESIDWKSGKNSWTELNECSTHLKPDDAATIWNHWVTLKLGYDWSPYLMTAEQWLERR